MRSHSALIALTLVVVSGTFARPAEPAAPPAKTAPVRFTLEKEHAKQDLEVRFQGKRKVTFKLTVTAPCKRTVIGTATSKGGDAESDEGDDGASYFVDEYKYTAKGGCYYAIRIDADDRTRARVIEADCKAACAPSDAVMKKTK